MPRKLHKYHYLYKTTNVINNKFYIGMHSTDDLNDGYLGSGKYLRRSINKHGTENFKIEFLEFFENRNDLKEKEKSLVNIDMLKDPLCMNLKTGGEGFDSITGRIGRLITNKILLNKLKTDPVYRLKFGTNVSRGLKNRYKNHDGPFYGKTHSKKTKNKMRKKAKLRIGSKNSQFGTCWITKENKNLKIKNEELQKWLDAGWNKGRFLKHSVQRQDSNL